MYAKKDIGYFLANAYYDMGILEEDELEKFRYLIPMLDSYNKFLERNLKLRINDVLIRSVIVSAKADQKNRIMCSIDYALKKNDKLELVRELVGSRDIPNKEELLIREF